MLRLAAAAQGAAGQRRRAAGPLLATGIRITLLIMIQIIALVWIIDLFNCLLADWLATVVSRMLYEQDPRKHRCEHCDTETINAWYRWAAS